MSKKPGITFAEGPVPRSLITVSSDGKISWPDDLTYTERWKAIAILKKNGIPIPDKLREGLWC